MRSSSFWLAACQRRSNTRRTIDADTPEPAWLGCAPSLIVIDSVERLEPPAQHSAFRALVQWAGSGCAVLAAGRWPPVDWPVREDLRTRLAAGLVFHLEPLSQDEAHTALVREAERRGIVLRAEVLHYLWSRFARDLGSLMGLLDVLDEFALSEKRAVTVPLIKQLLGA